jgi:spore maturation protein CgeB
LLQHPAEARAMGERGQRAIVERYNWEHEQHKVLDLYDRVSGSGKGDQSGGCKRKP